MKRIVVAVLLAAMMSVGASGVAGAGNLPGWHHFEYKGKSDYVKVVNVKNGTRCNFLRERPFKDFTLVSKRAHWKQCIPSKSQG